MPSKMPTSNKRIIPTAATMKHHSAVWIPLLLLLFSTATVLPQVSAAAVPTQSKSFGVVKARATSKELLLQLSGGGAGSEEKEGQVVVLADDTTSSTTKTTTTTTTTTTSSTSATHDLTAGQERIAFVKHILTARLAYVQDGKRQKDFKVWLKQQGGDVAVKSFHGVEVDWEPSTSTTIGLEQAVAAVTTTTHTNKEEEGEDALFPVDRLDLDLPSNRNLPSLYEGVPIHFIDDIAPSVVQLLWRTMQLSVKFSPVLSTTLLAVVSSRFRKVWYKWVAASLGSTSAAFIKWGQWASTRSDMFPDALCYELEQLQSSAPKHPWSFSEKMMESSLGLPKNALLDVFDDFDPEPLASGSIAQVYKAHLAGGTPVAIKIRHPRVAQLIDMDFRIMTAFARVCDYIPALAWLHIRESVEQFSHTMAAQAHLQVEGHHLEILNHNFRRWPTVNFPHPIYASSAVIIETFEPGAIVSDMVEAYDELASRMNGNQNSKSIVVSGGGDDDDDDEDTATGANGANSITTPDLIPPDTAKFIVSNGLGVYLKMLLVDNLMHADLHPGNIMLAAVEKGKGDADGGHDMDRLVVDPTTYKHIRGQTKLKICLVDAGMVAQLSEHESSTFIGLLSCLGTGNGRLAAKFAVKFSAENKLSDEEQEAFCADMDVLFQSKCQGYGYNVDVGDVMRGVLGLIRDHRVRIDANYATLVVNMLCIQSLAFKVCPSYNVLDASEPLLKSYFETFYKPDGTPKPRKAAITKFRRIMPFKYFQKSRNDSIFFNNLKKQQS